MNYAPILIATLNRYKHFKNCVESLLSNENADKTHLYIAFDAPLKKGHKEGYFKIKNYLENIYGFKELTIIKRKYNFGAFNNIKSAMSKIFKTYDRVIVSEDDNLFSKNFLNFVNEGLYKYEHKNEIFAICGYNYPISIPKDYNDEIYIWKGFSAWGFGVWRKKFEKVNFSIEEIRDYLKRPSNIKELNKYARHYLTGLLLSLMTKEIHGDVFLSMFLIKNNMYSVFPIVSKVRNMGHDGSGLHCKVTNEYSNQIIDDGNSNSLFPDYILPDASIERVLRKHFNIFSKRKFNKFVFRNIIMSLWALLKN